MVLARLRQGLSVEDLAFRFKVSVSTVSTIISTWVPFLAKELKSWIYWPRKEELQMFYPEAFKQFPHVSSIIDCTEIFLERPSMADTQALTYSTYKSHNTAKYLVRHKNKTIKKVMHSSYTTYLATNKCKKKNK